MQRLRASGAGFLDPPSQGISHARWGPLGGRGAARTQMLTAALAFVEKYNPPT